MSNIVKLLPAFFILIMIDKYIYKEILVSDYKEACKNFKGSKLLTSKNGLYFFLNKKGVLLYIGWCQGFNNRIGNHIRGSSNTSYFKDEIYKIKLIEESSFDLFRNKYNDCLDIEYYLIDKLKPKYNKQKGLKTAYNNILINNKYIYK